MEPFCCVAIDFDGTVTDVDVIDGLLQSFAPPEWREVETLWEQGAIGSRECLERQMAMIGQPLHRLLRFVDGLSIDPSFSSYVRFLRSEHVPFAIVSDGFQVFIDRLLRNAGITDVPILANVVAEEQGELRLFFPYSDPECASANCKCNAVTELSRDRSLIVIGDGRSDYCLAGRADYVYAKNKLAEHCRVNGIPHHEFSRFSQIEHDMRTRRVIADAPLAVRKEQL